MTKPSSADRIARSSVGRARKWWRIISFVGAVLAVSAVSLLVLTSGDQPHPGSADACIHFRSVARDALAGSLDGPEVREVFTEIGLKSNRATKAVKTASSRMLAAATEADTVKLAGHISEMATACAEAGH